MVVQKTMTCREAMNRLSAKGFRADPKRGRHRVFRHPDYPLTVAMSHGDGGGRELGPRELRAVRLALRWAETSTGQPQTTRT